MKDDSSDEFKITNIDGNSIKEKLIDGKNIFQPNMWKYENRYSNVLTT